MCLGVGGLHPLHNACSFGHEDVVGLLLEAGADPNTRDNWNYTPLHEAAVKGKIEICIGKIQIECKKLRVFIICNENISFIALLQHGADPTIRNSENKSPIDLANVSGVPGINEVLVGEWRKDEV